MPAAAKPKKSPPVFVSTAATAAAAHAAVPTKPAGAGWWQSVEESVLMVSTPPVERVLAEAGLPGSDRLARCPRCGCLLGDEELEPVCQACRQSPPTWAALVTLGSYSDPLADIVRQTKERPWPELGLAAGRALGQQLAGRLVAAGLRGALIVVIPVPTSRVRVVLRGIDHPKAIAQGLARGVKEAGAGHGAGRAGVMAERFAVSFCPILARRWRLRQAALSAWRRKENVLGSMTGRWLSRVPRLGGVARVGRAVAAARGAGRPVVAVLVDDVVTTGATAREGIRAARAALVGGGLRIGQWWVATVARVEVKSE